MARQDISMDASRGEVETTDNIVSKTFCPFILLDTQPDQDNDNWLFAEAELPAAQASRCGDGFEIRVRIPYVADTRMLKIRIRTDGGNGMPEYRPNPTDNRPWYPVLWGSEEENPQTVRMAEMWRCNSAGIFNLVLKGGSLMLYSGEETDLMIRPALGQNEVFLLKAFAGNLYQYPTTGVGLIEFLHGNFENTGLAVKLQNEFTQDGMVIHNAYMDSASGELYLEVTEKNG